MKPLSISGSPHVHSDESTKKIMWRVNLALVPMLLVGIAYFDGTKVYFVNLYSGVILEFCYIGKPFLVRSLSMKIPVQIILCDVRRIIAVPCTALGFPFDRRLDMFFTTNPQNPFIIDINIVMPVQFIPNSSIPHIRMLFMNSLDLFCNRPIAPFIVTDRIFQPAVVGSSR